MARTPPLSSPTSGTSNDSQVPCCLLLIGTTHLKMLHKFAESKENIVTFRGENVALNDYKWRKHTVLGTRKIPPRDLNCSLNLLAKLCENTAVHVTFVTFYV